MALAHQVAERPNTAQGILAFTDPTDTPDPPYCRRLPGRLKKPEIQGIVDRMDSRLRQLAYHALDIG